MFSQAGHPGARENTMQQLSSPAPRPFVDCGTCKGKGFRIITDRVRGVSMDMNAPGPFETLISSRPGPHGFTLYTVKVDCAICAGRGTMFLHPVEVAALARAAAQVAA